MNIEDGYDLPLRVTFQEEGKTPYWPHHLAALPHVGDTIILGSAPKGIRHVVRRIDHHVGAPATGSSSSLHRRPDDQSPVPRERTEYDRDHDFDEADDLQTFAAVEDVVAAFLLKYRDANVDEL